MKSNMSCCVSIPKSVTKVACISVRDGCMPVNGKLLLGIQLNPVTQFLSECIINQLENSQEILFSVLIHPTLSLNCSFYAGYSLKVRALIQEALDSSGRDMV